MVRFQRLTQAREGNTGPSNQAAQVQSPLATMEDELSLMEESGKEVTQEQKELLYSRVEELK